MGYKDASEVLLEIAKLLREIQVNGADCGCKNCGVSLTTCPVVGKVSDIIANEVGRDSELSERK